MREIIQQLDNLGRKVEKLAVLEGGSGVALQATYPGTQQTGNANISGTINAGTAINRNGIAMNNVTILSKVCRVLDDSTSRASGFSNSAVQVSGATDLVSAWVTLPASIKGVWYSVFLITAAAGTAVNLVIENPDFVVGAITLQGATSNVGGQISYSGGGVTSLSSLGRLRYLYNGSANVTRTIIDIWAYSV